MKLGKITVGTISLCMMAISTFLILESIILIKDTPVGNLFSGDSSEQNAEAFYLTQLGCAYSSFTAFLVALYVFFLAFLRTPYKKTMRETIEACFTREKIDAYFAKHMPGDPSTTMRNELYRIKEVKLKKTY